VGGIDDMRGSLETAIAAGETDSAGTAYINLGDAVWMQDGAEEGLKVHREGIEYCNRRGATQNAMWATGETTWMLFDTGDWDSLIRASDEVSEWVERGGGAQTEALCLPFKAKALLLRGDVAGSGRILQEHLPRARRYGDSQLLTPTLVTAAMWELNAQSKDRAIMHVREYVEVARDVPVYLCWQFPDALRILIACGEIAEAEQLVERTRPSMTRDLIAMTAARATLAEANGDSKEAVDLYLDAAPRWAAFPFPLEQGHALMGAGRCLVALGRTDDARERFEQARTIFVSLGALPLVAEVDALSR
jgi:hypothetical protein